MLKYTQDEWDDWKWQVCHAAEWVECLRAWGGLAEAVLDLSKGVKGHLPVKVTPYYARMLARDETGALLKTMIPGVEEDEECAEELEDPLGEKAHQVTACVVHTYPDKVLFLASDYCAVHCRYCTRYRWLGQGACSQQDWEEGLRYIEAHAEVRDVLISGGDPLMMSDGRLEWLLSRLRAISHVELIRIGSKVPAALPQRITSELVAMLRRFQPLWLVAHFTHPAELSEACEHACAMLADAGIPLASQTVLLKGVNDDAAVLKALMTGLLKLRVRPYYLLQCDAVRGAARFRTAVRKGQQLIRQLHGYTTGLAVPTFMIDAPGGGGKVPVGPSYIAGYDGDAWALSNYRNERCRYYDPASAMGEE